MATELVTTAATSDLDRAFAALQAKQERQTDLWRYYDGDQPLAYSTQRLRDIFRKLDTHFAENWCSVVIDSIKDRVNLTALRHEQPEVAGALAGLWDLSELDLGSDDVHEAALVVGESYLVVWPDEEGVPQAHYNDPRLCHVQYSAENPRIAAWAAKRWVDEAGKLRMTLYYPDRLEYYISSGKSADVQTGKSLREAEPPAPNPYGQIPVFHFRPQRRGAKSELQSVIPLQDAINKLLSDMMVVAEFGAFPQRWIISQADSTEPLENTPFGIWDIPGGDGQSQAVSVGQFSAADLGNYLKAIDNLAAAIGTITRTPRHYFLGEAGASLSGEALIAMEGPLNHKAQDRIDAFAPTWRRAASFLLRLLGQDVPPSEIIAVFDRPETVQPRTMAEITQMRVSSGLPLKSALRMEGLSEAEIEEVQADQVEEAAAREETLGQALLAAQGRFDAGGGVGNE